MQILNCELQIRGQIDGFEARGRGKEGSGSGREVGSGGGGEEGEEEVMQRGFASFKREHTETRITHALGYFESIGTDQE
ncbi:hypothetical protein CVT26_015051 [Gymnopilus dilepis]|uniref:Uncharacterized protein n=1 Tax=Gymnopilus dilepis TaxID=231916 RepID=A0A409W405_9AGAR|nr:hypothetical protein CVT26_015051 [Gymnopilus dilepis]